MRFPAVDEDRATHQQRLRVLRAMSPDQRLRATLALSELTRQLFYEGLRRRYPGLPEPELRRLFRERLDLCHSRTS